MTSVATAGPVHTTKPRPLTEEDAELQPDSRQQPTYRPVIFCIALL